MNLSEHEINVAYCFDEGYAPYSAVSTLSLLCSQKATPKVYWCVTPSCLSVGRELASRVEFLAGVSPELIEVDGSLFSGWTTRGHIPGAAYLRLLLPQVLREEKVIYLDGDTLVLADLSDLYSTELGSHVLAGVVDRLGTATSKIPRPPSDPYLNSGVLVMDLSQLRKDRFLERCADIHDTYKDGVRWLDQCLINKHAEGRKLALPAAFNFQVFANTLTLGRWINILQNKEIKILHFVGDVKPWQEWCNPRVAEYWWGFARKLGSDRLELQKLSSLDQAVQLTRSLDLNEMYQQSSEIKGRIIEALLKQLHGVAGRKAAQPPTA
jgi:lipopolysaccharide biosynthesis glycosyltransferase